MDNAVQEAKALLKEKGYFIDNLWHIDDVRESYVCEDDVMAQEVLESALTNEATMDQIWFALRFHAEENNLKQILWKRTM